MILKLYILISVLMIVTFLLCCICATGRLSEDIKNKMKEKKMPLCEKILLCVKMLMMGFCPIINIVFLYTCTIKYEWFVEEICKFTIKKYE